MIGIAHLIDGTVDRLHVGGMQDIVNTKPEEVLIIGDPYATAGSGISIFQLALDRTMGIRDRRIIEITANQYIIGIDLFNLFGNSLCLARPYPEGGS